MVEASHALTSGLSNSQLDRRGHEDLSDLHKLRYFEVSLAFMSFILMFRKGSKCNREALVVSVVFGNETVYD